MTLCGCSYFGTNVGIGGTASPDAMLEIYNPLANALSVNFASSHNIMRFRRTGGADLAFVYKPDGSPLTFQSESGGGTSVPGFRFVGAWGVAIDAGLSVGGVSHFTGTLNANGGIVAGPTGVYSSGPITVTNGPVNVTGAINASDQVSGLGFVAGTNGLFSNGPLTVTNGPVNITGAINATGQVTALGFVSGANGIAVGGPISSIGATALVLGTGGTERLRIAADGVVQIHHDLTVSHNVSIVEDLNVGSAIYAGSGPSPEYPRKIADGQGCYYA